MSQSTKKEIQSFLSCIRAIIYKPNGFHIVDRKKNMKALTENNIPIEIAKLYIEKLKVKNYCRGPLKDKNKNYNHKW